MAKSSDGSLILVTGATGYVGGRLVPRSSTRDVACACSSAIPGASGPRLGRARRRRRRRRPAAGDARCVAGGRGGRLLPRALDGEGRGVPRARPRGGESLRQRRPGRGRQSPHLPRRTRGSRRRPLAAPALAPGDRRGAARGRRAGHGVSRRRRRRRREYLLRDDPLLDRASPRDGLPAMGLHAGAADRRRRPAALPRVGARRARERRSRGRGGRHRRAHLRGDDARVRACPGSAAAPAAGAGPHAEAVVVLGPPCHADPLDDGSPAHRGSPQRDDRARARRPRPVPRYPPGGL